MKNKEQILVIDDTPQEYDKIKSLLPPDYTILNEKYIKNTVSVNTFANFGTNDESTYTFIKNALSKYYKNVRMIICDLKLGSDDSGGRKVVSSIRKWDVKEDLGMPSEFSWYVKYIPLVCVSQLNKNEVDTISLSMDGCDFVSKPPTDYYNIKPSTSKGNDECLKYQKIFKSQIAQFSFLCKAKNLNYKYTIAISYNNNDNNQYFIDAIAQGLCLHYGRNRVFLDNIHTSAINSSTQKNEKLKKIYLQEAQYILVVLSPNYGLSDGTKEEWEAIGKRDDKNNCLIFIQGTSITDLQKHTLEVTLNQSWPITGNPLGITEPTFQNKTKGEIIDEYKKYYDNIKRTIIDDIVIRKIEENE